tara:strand:- start:664 stop:867 length:204 start_codon:yes stop_codon:yes gene_type:complete
MKKPVDMKPVLAKVQRQGSLRLYGWCEVVYFDDVAGIWRSFSGSTTFEDGEQVIAWDYIDNIELTNK